MTLEDDSTRNNSVVYICNRYICDGRCGDTDGSALDISLECTRLSFGGLTE
jgi:hypothetical protein